MINSTEQLKQALADCLEYLSQAQRAALSGLVTAVTPIESPNGNYFTVSIWDGAGTKIYPFAGKADAGQGGSLVDPASLPVLTRKVSLDATPPHGNVELWLLNGWTEG